MTISLADLNSGDYSAALSYGADATGTSDAVFHAQGIVGDAMNDAATATTVLNAFKTSGGVDLTGAAAEAQMNKLIEAMQIIPVVGQVLGGAIYAITQAGGFAHAGAGTCANPPDGPSFSQLQAWPHYTDWANSIGQTSTTSPWQAGDDPAGSFEDVANRMLAYNRALQDNCFVQGTLPPPVLLAQVIAAWNGAHQGPTRMVTRTMPGPNIGGRSPNFDPIAEALTRTGDFSAGQKVSFPVNTGPANPKVIVLKLGPGGFLKPAGTVGSTSTVALTTTSKVALSSAIVGGSALAGVAVWAHVTRQTYGAAWGKLFRKVKR